MASFWLLLVVKRKERFIVDFACRTLMREHKGSGKILETFSFLTGRTVLLPTTFLLMDADWSVKDIQLIKRGHLHLIFF